MTELEMRTPHSVGATMRLTGRQRSQVTVQHGGTPEATVTVAIGRSVIYLRTRTTARHLAGLWQRARTSALRLPVRQPLQPFTGSPAGVAQTSVVVHTAGLPATITRLWTPRAGQAPGYLHVQFGDLAFLLHDQQAFDSCADAFTRAAAAADEHLPRIDNRNAPVRRARPALTGRLGPRAADALDFDATALGIATTVGDLARATLSPITDLLQAVDGLPTSSQGGPQPGTAARASTAGGSADRPAGGRHPAAQAAAALSPAGSPGRRPRRTTPAPARVTPTTGGRLRLGLRQPGTPPGPPQAPHQQKGRAR